MHNPNLTQVYSGRKLSASSSHYIEKKSTFHLGEEDYMLSR